jgi:TonB family protein
MKITRVFRLLVSAGVLLISTTLNAQPAQSSDLARSQELNATVLKLFAAGQYAEALPLAREALQLRERALGSEHEDLIPLITNLGEISYALKTLDDAEAFFRRAIALSEKAFGKNDVRLAPMWERLAFVEHDRKKDEAAETALSKALGIRENANGGQEPAIAQAAFNLGQLYQINHDYEKAAPLYARAIAIWENAGEAMRPKLLKALEADVLVLTALNKTEEVSKVQLRVAELSGKEAVVNGGVLNGKALALMTPSYPMAARSDRASGTVRVQVLIAEDGHVISAKAIDAGRMHPALITAAENAARKSRFSPTFFNGQPVKVNGIIIYNFVAR